MKTDGQEMQHVPKERGRGLIFSLLQNPRTLRSVASINMKEEASVRPRTRRERKRRMRKLENETSFVNVDQGGIDDFLLILLSLLFYILDRQLPAEILLEQYR